MGIVNKITSTAPHVESKLLEIVFSLASEDDTEPSDGQSYMYPYVWLRDNCQCPDCFQADAGARLLLFRDLDLHESPDTIQLSDDGVELTITWSSGHVSSYRSDWLLERRFSGDVSLERECFLELPQIPWGSEMQDNIKRDTFQNLVTQDEALYGWISELERTGIFLVTGAPPHENALRDIAKRVSHLKTTSYGDTFKVETKKNPSNLAYTAKTLGLHTDLAHYSYVPGIQMLHCITKSSKGGANEFADGFHVAEQLREINPGAFKILAETIVDFVDFGTESGRKFHMLNRKPVIRLDDNGKVSQISHNNALRDSHLCLLPENVMDFYKAMRQLENLLYAKENVINLTLNAGEIIFFHNYRVLHGRQGYRVDFGDQRLLIGGYIDWDELRSTRRVLETKFTK